MKVLACDVQHECIDFLAFLTNEATAQGRTALNLLVASSEYKHLLFCQGDSKLLNNKVKTSLLHLC